MCASHRSWCCVCVSHMRFCADCQPAAAPRAIHVLAQRADISRRVINEPSGAFACKYHIEGERIDKLALGLGSRPAHFVLCFARKKGEGVAEECGMSPLPPRRANTTHSRARHMHIQGHFQHLSQRKHTKTGDSLLIIYAC